MKSLLPLGMRQLIFPYSLPGSGTPKKCSWQSNVSNRGFSPAVMYHRPCAAHLSGQNNLLRPGAEEAGHMHSRVRFCSAERILACSKAHTPKGKQQAKGFAGHKPHTDVSQLLRQMGITWKLFRSNFSSSAVGGGCGKVDSSTRCGTHFLSLTAHAVKASTALSAYRSPHRICRV